MKACATCGYYPRQHYTCESCGAYVHMGEWYQCPHGKPTPSKGYEPHWDKHITDHPVWISTPGDKKKYLKPHWKEDNLIHVQERD